MALRMAAAWLGILWMGTAAWGGEGAGAKVPLTAEAFFAGAPMLALQQTEPLTVLPYVQPVIFAPASKRAGEATWDAERVSCYIGSIGKIVEIQLDTDEVVEHAVPFDGGDGDNMQAGAYTAWVGPDDCIYFSMNHKPGVVARLDPATGKVARIELGVGWGPHNCAFGPGGKVYFATYMTHLLEVDMATGAVRNLGRMAEDQVYMWADMWVAEDGYFYCQPGTTNPAPRRLDLKSGEIQKLEKLPAKVLHHDTPVVKHAALTKKYDVQMVALPERVTVTIKAKDAADAKVHTATFVAGSSTSNLSVLTVGADGNIYGSGLYRHFIFDPRTGAVTRLNFRHSIADMIVVGPMIYFSGYPHATLGVLDTTRAFTAPFDGSESRHMAKLTNPEENPHQLVALMHTADPAGAPKKTLLMNRLWTIEAMPDGRIFMGATASRHAHGGALAAWNPADQSVVSWRKEFAGLGVRAICAVDGGRKLAAATWVSVDPDHPEVAPSEARLFMLDVERGELEWSAAPLPGCKVLMGIIQAPGTRRLIGVGLRGVEPSDKDDDSFYADGHVFIFDMDQRATVADFPLAFRVGQREGRPLTVAPDGTVWAAGGTGGGLIAGPNGGGLFRIDAAKLTMTPVARCEGVVGNFVFQGETLYMGGGSRLRWGDVSGVLVGVK